MRSPKSTAATKNGIAKATDPMTTLAGGCTGVPGATESTSNGREAVVKRRRPRRWQCLSVDAFWNSGSDNGEANKKVGVMTIREKREKLR